MPGIFAKIAAGEIPSFKIGETKNCFAFLDINPLTEGHVLVIPKNETDYLFDVEDGVYNELMEFAKKVAKAIPHAVTCKRIGVAVVGLEVPHAHIHLIPINSVSDMNFSKPKLSLPRERMEEIAAKIASAI